MNPKLKVCAVSYLNTAPLVWGMTHGPQRGLFEISFRLPAECADLLASGQVDIGIAPVVSLLRQELETVPGLGIASFGPVRSILLVSKRALGSTRSLATDSSSRTSVELARIVLRDKYGSEPQLVSLRPDLPLMLKHADAALVIGDPALRLDVKTLPYEAYDLGAEWTELTGLPMVFALWTARKGVITSEVAKAFQESCYYGQMHIDDIVRMEAPPRRIAVDLARRYMTQHILYQLDEAAYRGLDLFLRSVRQPDVIRASKLAARR